jgi:hypothetical protein
MGRTIELGRGYTAVVDNKDYARVVAAGPWSALVPPSRNTVYAKRNRRKDDPITQTYLHRFILGLTDPQVLADHWDGDGLNNRRKNLRTANHSQSQCNRGTQKNNTSGFSGVSWREDARKYEAYIKIGRKRKHLGLFVVAEDAADAVAEAREALHKEFSVDRRKQ